MNKLKEQLKALTKSLVALSRQADKLTKQVDKLQTSQAAAAKKKAVKKKTPKKKVVKRKATKKKIAKKGSSKKKPTVLDSVYSNIKKNKNGITIPKLQQKTGLGSKQLSNALFKLTQKGVIKTKERGIYQAK